MDLSGTNMIGNSGKNRVLDIRELGAGTFVLRIERRNLDFQPGQYIHVGPLGGIDRREYSVYSSPDSDYLEILVKEVETGAVSPKLRTLSRGDSVDVEGPFGFFRIEGDHRSASYLFIATGTGISPFHCLTGSFPGMDYLLVHGIRTLNECYDHEDYERERLVTCVSREKGGDYSGRVTDWLRDNPVKSETFVYLCGNCDMIYEVYDILGSQGVSADRIHAEVYF